MKWFLVVPLVLCSQAFAAEDPSTRHISKDPISDLELQIIEHGDTRSAGKVLARLQVLHKEKGSDAIRPALPAIKARLEALQTKGENSKFEHNVVSFLCKIGDTGLASERLLLKAVRRGDDTAAFGLLKFNSAIDSLTSYLHDSDSGVRSSASRTLVRMYRRKSDHFTKSQTDLIRVTLIEKLSEYEYKSSNLSALGTFGNDSTIPVLKNFIESNGPADQNPDVRFAQWAIDQINRQ